MSHPGKTLNKTQTGVVCASEAEAAKLAAMDVESEPVSERAGASVAPASQALPRRGSAEPTEADGFEETGEHIAVRQPSADSEQERVRRVWRQWLGALATDSEAALAAALAYQQLDDQERDCWLEAVEADAERVGVPPVAVYAPLLAVEADSNRRERITRSVSRAAEAGWEEQPCPQHHRALWGGEGSHRVAVLIGPLYLDFVQIIACSYRPGECFEWVRHDPIAKLEQVPLPGCRIGDCVVHETPLQAAIDELAATVLAHRRTGRDFPEGLCALVDWFGPLRRPAR